MTKNKSLKLAFDLDGTLYDTLRTIHRVDNAHFASLGYPSVSFETYQKEFSANNWKEMYRNLGIRENDIPKIIDMFDTGMDEVELPALIPGALELIVSAERHLGKDNIHFITNERPHRVRKRFERDGLAHYLPQVTTPQEGKAEAISTLAVKSTGPFWPKSPLYDLPVIYVGDTVSDGAACAEGWKTGLWNLWFCAIAHPYAFSKSGELEKFAQEYPERVYLKRSLSEVEQLWLHVQDS